jgi:hypothetical protein
MNDRRLIMREYTLKSASRQSTEKLATDQHG